MKTKTGIIILAVFLAFVIAVIITASIQNSNSNTTTTKITTTVSTKKVTTTKVTISSSTREDLAEKEVLKEALREMRYGYSSSLFKKYDVDSTRYKIGKVEKKGDTFTFYITFYLYDNYGNYKDKLQKSISVDVDEYGKVGYVYITFYDWDFN